MINQRLRTAQHRISKINTGCDFWDDCLTCPLPRCRFDEGGVPALLMALFREDYENGMTIPQLAKRYKRLEVSIERRLAWGERKIV